MQCLSGCSYDERCHQTYVTTYEPHQEEECDEKFRKVCTIWYEEKAISEMVEECTTPVVAECQESERTEDCRTVYDTVCDTRQVGYEVEEGMKIGRSGQGFLFLLSISPTAPQSTWRNARM